MKVSLSYLFLFLFLILIASCRQEQNQSAQSGQNVADTSLPEKVFFSEHVASIVYKNCSPCHRPGEAGPFPLTNYEEVFKKKKTIAKVVKNNIMPPWPADRSYRNFAGEMYLTGKEKAVLLRWVEQGGEEGDPSLSPAFPDFPKGSQLGTPDLVLRMPKPYILKGDNKDKYVLMKIPFEIPEDKYVRAVEFVPDNRRRVHHVNGYMVVYDEGKKKNAADGELYVHNYDVSLPEAYDRMKLANDDGTYPLLIPAVTNYLPGVVTPVYPKGIGGFTMRKQGAILLKDIHYGPTPKNESDQSYFNIFFSDVPPIRRFREFQLGTYGVSKITPPLMVPPDSIKTFYSQYTILDDISLVTINPHMHLLGKSFLAYAITPSGEHIPLIRIPRWDFRWQYFYTFKKMLKLPAYTIIYVEATYDNTRNNPNNPFDPPQWVGEREGSMSTRDEMLQFIVTYLPYKPGDENISLENTRLE